MSIRKRTIEENSRRTVCMKSGQTLKQAIQTFENLKYSENDTYLVIRLSSDKYNVILFSELKEILGKLGFDGLTKPLSNLPIPLAGRIVPTDTEESGGDVIDWITRHPQSRVVVTDAGKFSALFVNPNRTGDSGLLDNLSLLELHGELVQLSQDPRSDYKTKIQAPTCPHCHQANFYSLNDAMQFFCPNCKETVE